MSLAVLLLLQIATGQPASGHDVVARMHDRWQGKWFRTLTFVQRTRFPDGSAQTWYETVANPGRLRIDFGPVDSMTTAIMKHDSIFQFQHGKPLGGQPYPSILGTALSDVYAQPVAETVAQLERGGVDLFKLRADTLRGRRAWVIGALAGDSTAPQLWIDQERLLLLRLHEPGPDGTVTVAEVLRRAAGPVPVETEMAFRENGKEVQHEEYSRLTFDARLDPWMFETGRWQRPSWIPK
ncbi:MAG: hypothetical protein ABJC36_09445 [Gemmatimonadales bacterium]